MLHEVIKIDCGKGLLHSLLRESFKIYSCLIFNIKLWMIIPQCVCAVWNRQQGCVKPGEQQKKPQAWLKCLLADTILLPLPQLSRF